MISKSSLGEPVHSAVWMGIKFSRKSPAVGSMKRHCPLGAFIGTDENARVAVSSRGLDSATAEGWRMPPAPETVTGVVGLKSRMPEVSIPAGPVGAVAMAGAEVTTVKTVVGVIEDIIVGPAETDAVMMKVDVTIDVDITMDVDNATHSDATGDDASVTMATGNEEATIVDAGARAATDVSNARSMPAVGVKLTDSDPAKVNA